MMMSVLRSSFLGAAVLLLAGSAVLPASAFIHDLVVTKDPREQFFIEQFGFASGGVIDLEVDNMLVNNAPVDKKTGAALGFIAKRAETDAQAEMGEPLTHGGCVDKYATDLDFEVHVEGPVVRANYTVPPGAEGFYNMFFVSCRDMNAEMKYVSFELKMSMYNLDPFTGEKSYLPAGKSGLPTLYLFFSACYVGWIVLWIVRFMRPAWSSVNRMHLLITLLYVLKSLSLFFNGMDKHFLKVQGHADGWAVLYYIFASLKTVGLFLLIALIGTGFTFVKPFLSDRDKKIFMVVIPLQIIDNIAMIVLEETAPGSQDWAAWKDIFRLIDIVCCGAVLVPIIWSIKHLREAAQSSGKARQSLAKLQLFREFYLLVVSYIYFTRIVVYLLEATLPFHRTWMAQAAYEVATLSFLVIIGYKFRPADNNPYFELKEADSDDEAVQAELLAIEIDSDDAAALHPRDDDQDIREPKGRMD